MLWLVRCARGSVSLRNELSAWKHLSVLRLFQILAEPRERGDDVGPVVFGDDPLAHQRACPWRIRKLIYTAIGIWNRPRQMEPPTVVIKNCMGRWRGLPGRSPCVLPDESGGYTTYDVGGPTMGNRGTGVPTMENIRERMELSRHLARSPTNEAPRSKNGGDWRQYRGFEIARHGR